MNETSTSFALLPPFEDPCVVESVDRRWYLVAVCGTLLSLVSIVANIVNAKVLLSSNHPHFFFLALLALSDCFLSLNYGPVIAMDIIKDRLKLFWLTRLYLVYVGPLLALCLASMTFSCYLIILATIERFLIIQKAKCFKIFRKSRGLLALLAFILALILRAPFVFETQIEKNENEECVGGINEYVLNLTPIVNTFWYGTVYRFYMRNILTVLVPFVLLAFLNYKIVSTLRDQHRNHHIFHFMFNDHKKRTSEKKSQIRSATLLMVFIVCSYLIANVLNVIITLWEYVSFQSTQTGDAFLIYEACTDITSVLYIFVCATRLFVYYLCNKEIRDGINQLICNIPIMPEKQEYVTITRSYDSSRQIGTDIDRIAIAIARRLLCGELVCSANSGATESFVISNSHALEIEEDYDDDDGEGDGEGGEGQILPEMV